MENNEKAIALAVNFKNAPKELQAAATASNDSSKKLANLQDKLLDLQSQIKEQNKLNNSLLNAFQDQLAQWDGETLTDKAAVK